MVGCLMCTDKEQEADQISLWKPVIQLPVKVGHLVSLDFLLSCDIARDDANLLLETGVGFFVVQASAEPNRLSASGASLWDGGRPAVSGTEGRHWVIS